MKCKTTYSNLRLGVYPMHVPQSLLAMLSSSGTCAPCFYLKNDVAHGLSILKNTP